MNVYGDDIADQNTSRLKYGLWQLELCTSECERSREKPNLLGIILGCDGSSLAAGSEIHVN